MRSVDTVSTIQHEIEPPLTSLEGMRRTALRWCLTNVTSMPNAFGAGAAAAFERMSNRAETGARVMEIISTQNPCVDLDAIPIEERKKAKLLEILLADQNIALPINIIKGGQTYTIRKLNIDDSSDTVALFRACVQAMLLKEISNPDFEDLREAWLHTDDKKRHGRFGSNYEKDLISKPLQDLHKKQAEIFALCSGDGSVLATVDVYPELNTDVQPDNRLADVAYTNLAAPEKKGLVSDLLEAALAEYTKSTGIPKSKFYIHIEKANADSRKFFRRVSRKLEESGISAPCNIEDGDEEYCFTLSNPNLTCQLRQAA